MVKIRDLRSSLEILKNNSEELIETKDITKRARIFWKNLV